MTSARITQPRYVVNQYGKTTTGNVGLDVASDLYENISKVNKFGESLKCDSGAKTDIWDGADGSTSTIIWMPPTQARTHVIASTSGNDAASGTGMQTMQVYGLVDWDTKESSEIVSVGDTTSAYVIIHRIKGLTFGSGGTNAGIITATASTDATVTAAVQAGIGQTLMAIYGIPSTQKFQLEYLRSDILKSVLSVVADGVISVKENADLSTSGWIIKERFQFQSSDPLKRPYPIPKTFNGPCIIKFQVTTGTNNCQVTCGFDGYVIDK